MRRQHILLIAFTVTALLAVLESRSRALLDADVTGDFGAPIPGLTPGQLAVFEIGRDVFDHRFTRDEGLGPHFNASSCTSCHEDPVTGGSSERYRDFFLVARRLADGSIKKVYEDCTDENRITHRTKPCLPSLVMPHFGPHGTIGDPIAPEVEHPRIPEGDDIIAARRNAPPVFGIGLFRLVDDAEILARADPADSDGDGISGRANIISSESGAVGRFGYKCQTASIEAFNRGALLNQMGLTSDSLALAAETDHPGEAPSLIEELLVPRVAWAQIADPRERIVDFDAVFDPEITRGELSALVFFQEHLAAPRRGPESSATRRGEATFARIGCASCHVPSLETSVGVIHPYTDLLIHDMGPGLADGIVMEGAGPSEFRTQPLWGLCEHAPFLHDGRADTVAEAILEHGGEAAAARERYLSLDAAETRDLHRFLESL